LLLFFARAVLDWLPVISRGLELVGGCRQFLKDLGCCLVAAGDFWRTWVAVWWLPAIAGWVAGCVDLGLWFFGCLRGLLCGWWLPKDADCVDFAAWTCDSVGLLIVDCCLGLLDLGFFLCVCVCFGCYSGELLVAVGPVTHLSGFIISDFFLFHHVF
jgi:hypothetical protein